MPLVTLARHAMATRFEMVLHGENSVALRAAGEEALEEIDRLEAQLSVFRPSSEIAHLNARASRESVRVTPRLFGLLQRARALYEESGGAFDITIAPLVRCWGFMGGSGRLPTEEEVARTRAVIGMDLVELRPEDFTVRFLREGVMLDLGAIGKGYAIEQAAELLRDAGITNALLHGGTSTIQAIGHPADSESWQIALTSPDIGFAGLSGIAPVKDPDSTPQIGHAAMVPLNDEALSVSAVWGKYFRDDEKAYGHIIDPRTGRPASQAVMAVVALASATDTDALSTALLTVGPDGHDALVKSRQSIRTLVIAQTDGQFRHRSKGIEWLNSPTCQS
ncbi:MAG TPA: FAD:protein FMN transferase [Candidatus Limnocylindrales bacterium]|nr:FAD:protein FMN transferase [Candidatus Limnocylindrales bacterium]